MCLTQRQFVAECPLLRPHLVSYQISSQNCIRIYLTSESLALCACLFPCHLPFVDSYYSYLRSKCFRLVRNRCACLSHST